MTIKDKIIQYKFYGILFLIMFAGEILPDGSGENQELTFVKLGSSLLFALFTTAFTFIAIMILSDEIAKKINGKNSARQIDSSGAATRRPADL
jgi:hypothetical protein